MSVLDDVDKWDNSDSPEMEVFLGTVLVVDDIPANVRLLSRILELAGHQVLAASGGQEALDIIDQENLDLVLLDVMMPDMNGFETCRRIRQNSASRHLPVVFVTALTDVSDRVKALEVGADDFISKPVEANEVTARATSLIRAKRGRDQLERAYADLKRSESLRDSLTQMLVHDLRTPLTSLLVSMDVLLGEQVGPLNEAQQQLMALSRRGGGNLLNLINDLLDVARLSSGQMPLNKKSVSITELAESALLDVEPIVRDRKATVNLDWAETLPSITADPALLQRVLVNLISNALKFSPAGATIALGAMVNAPETNAQLQTGELLMWVRDNGYGIGTEQQRIIWEKFGQAEAARQATHSTGLGLTFCKLVIEAHGGKIGVESAPRQGSTFHFTLPLEPFH